MILMKLTKYERARLIGARALQIAMGAPLLMKMKEADFQRIHYRPVTIAKMELEKNVLPLTIKRPMPLRIERAKEE